MVNAVCQHIEIIGYIQTRAIIVRCALKICQTKTNRAISQKVRRSNSLTQDRSGGQRTKHLACLVRSEVQSGRVSVHGHARQLIVTRLTLCVAVRKFVCPPEGIA
jgi:hypothetical protein